MFCLAGDHSSDGRFCQSYFSAFQFSDSWRFPRSASGNFVAGGGMSLLVIGCIAMMISMLVPNATWSIRIVSGLVFTAYAWYLVHEWIIDFDGNIGFGRPRSEANPNNALAGFIVIGLPALWYTVLGRFTLRQEITYPIFRTFGWGWTGVLQGSHLSMKTEGTQNGGRPEGVAVGKIVELNEEVIKAHLNTVVLSTVEET
jgi:hypothetical protein